MQCREAKLLIHAYLDNELSAGDSVRLIQHLNECPTDRRVFEDHVQLKALLQREKPRHVLPDAMRARITAALPLPATQAGLIRRLPAVSWRAIPIALAASLLLMLGGSLGIAWQWHTTNTTSLTANLLSNHVRSLQELHLTDVLTSDQHTVKPWFDGKIDYSPQVRNLSEDGFSLIGGRLDLLNGRRVAAIIYGRGRHPINLFQRPEYRPDSAPIAEDVGEGYTIIRWTQDNMNYWAISNLNRPELEMFANAFRKAPSRKEISHNK